MNALWTTSTLKILFGVLFFTACVYVASSRTPQAEPPETKNNLDISQEIIPAPPTRLSIPTIDVDASIQRVGLTANGAMDVPTNAVDAGWFDLGTIPGEIGSAVIAGHFNGKDGEPGVFENLGKLAVGTELLIEDEKGRVLTFIVEETRVYDAGRADEIFTKNDGVYLNLITCDGVWDEKQKSYTKRLIVLATLKPLLP